MDNKLTYEKPEQCPSCGFYTEDLKPYTEDWLCEFCANTMAGAILKYPNQQRSNNDIIRAICYVGNAILKEAK